MRLISGLPIVSVALGAPLAMAAPADNFMMPEVLIPPASPAETVSLGPVFSYSATAASNYIFRGVSQTSNDPAIFGAARVTYDQFYAGVGIENVNFHTTTAAEYDLSGGWAPKYNGFQFDLGVIRYGYINEPAFTHIDTVEFKAAVSHDLGPVTLGTSANYTSDFFGTGHKALYFQGRAAYRITKTLIVGGALGRQLVSDGQNHTTWNAGVNYTFLKHFSVDVRYYDTNEHALGDDYRSHYVASIKAAF